MGIPLAGEWIATFAFLPVGILAVLRVAVGITGHPGDGFIVLGGIVLFFWLLIVEEMSRVRFTRPIISIPIIWLAPPAVIIGLIDLIMG